MMTQKLKHLKLFISVLVKAKHFVYFIN